jgi:3-dehydroquinate dehydratase-1
MLTARTEPVQVGQLSRGGPGRPKVIVPITATTFDELTIQLDRVAHSRADIVEWRADYFKLLHNQSDTRTAALRIRAAIAPRPLLFTVRTEEEGGCAKLDAGDLTAIYRPILATDVVDAVDIEYLNPEASQLAADAKAVGIPVIGSHHIWLDPDGKPSEVMSNPDPGELYMAHLRYIEEFNADIVKLGVMPRDFRDVAALMSITTAFTAIYETPVISMAMGKLGRVSRIFSGDFGSAATFSKIADGEASAPGQLSLDKLLALWHQLGIE